MDPIVTLEQNAIDRQKSMIDALTHGDSDVLAFYRQKTIFVTGGTGFLGKLLIEKLFRTCDLKQVYILIRSKMNSSPVERLSEITNDSIFDSVRHVNPSFANKITAIEGDVCELSLGISDANWHRIAEEVNIIFHIAANVRFDTSLKDVTLSNVRGTREALKLGKACKNLNSFVFLSTAFSQATSDVIGKTVLEEFGSCPITPDELIHIAETYNTEHLNNISPTLVKGWPNTYTFSKAISEELVRTMGDDLPVCVVRPAIVTTTYTEPALGWLDKSTIYGSNGVALGILMGVVQVIQCDSKCRVELVPADMTTNATIVAASTTAAKRTTGCLHTDIYTVTSTRNPITWRKATSILAHQRFKLVSPKTNWFINPIPIKNSVIFTVLIWLFHYIPAYIFDGFNKITGKKAKFVKLYSKTHKLLSVLKYFCVNEWHLSDTNLQNLYNSLSETDKAIFNFDITSLDWKEHNAVTWYGIRKYILKDGLKDTVKSVKKQYYYCIADILLKLVVLSVFLFIIYYVSEFILLYIMFILT